MALSRRTWLFTPLILPVTGLGAVAAGAVVAVLVADDLGSILGWVAILVVIGLGVVWNVLAGAEVQHRRVAAARAQWARSRPDAAVVADGAPDAQDAELLRRHAWRVQRARGRLRFEATGTPVRAETWVMRAMSRSRLRREIVAADVETGSLRVWIPLAAPASPLLEPGWAGREPEPDPTWLPAVRARSAEYEGIVSGLAIGFDRVIVIGSDDARIETMLARAELVHDVVQIIAGDVGGHG